MKGLLTSTVVMVLLVACGDTVEVDNIRSTAEDLIVDEFAKEGWNADASCADPTSSDSGTNFSCTATLDDGSIVPVRATVDGDFVEIEYLLP